ncbi:hypothetical protein DENIS_4052 [Desulfonema ishimotonii]|uniref:VWFA domain-containing protein n=1 Tax=Desulfonema ishimotonii TaxID=45657 RepID=A0A401G1J9_9BACT|nr:vWA domain-containing protein [Desulfonema ishimotonii]GBC63063.1 hypothetical protein DENIS_4052 [Desulfonema ishimotonii]
MIRLYSRNYYILLWALILFPILPEAAHALSEITNDDFIIILDQSGSMREKVPGNENKGYEKLPMSAYKSKGAIEGVNQIVDHIIKEGDYFALITFGNKADVLVSQQIGYDHERELIKERVIKLPFKDKKTDILAGLAKASELLNSLKTPQRRKILLMLTDGIEEPPGNSPFKEELFQKKFYKDMGDTIRFYKWDVVLVGIGEHTKENIQKIAQNLGLAVERAKTVENPNDGEELSKILVKFIDDRKNAFIQLEKKLIKLTLKPALFGGYETEYKKLPLKSFFDEDVEVILNTRQPVRFSSEGLGVSANPITLNFTPQQSQKLNLIFAYEGKRPEDGRIIGNYAFQFAEDSLRFYPYEGSYQVILPSWWEVYGLWAMLALAATLFLILLLIWIIRRVMAPEIRISVTTNGNLIGASMTIRRKKSFSIANDDFGGLSVPAKGLSCNTAARVTYLGRKQFKINAVDAAIEKDGKEYSELKLGLEKPFDLKDKSGKYLRFITIGNVAESDDDPFGGGYDSDSF